MLFLHSTHRSWLLSLSLRQKFWRSPDEDSGHFRTLFQEATFLPESSFFFLSFFLIVSITMNWFLQCIIPLSRKTTERERCSASLFQCFWFKSSLFCLSLPCRFNSIMSGKSVTCIKLHLFTTDWTWTDMTVPLSYDIIPQVCLWICFGIVTVKNLVKVLMFLKEILMCFQFNFPLLNKVCRIKKNNQIKWSYF